LAAARKLKKGVLLGRTNRDNCGHGQAASVKRRVPMPRLSTFHRDRPARKSLLTGYKLMKGEELENGGVAKNGYCGMLAGLVAW